MQKRQYFFAVLALAGSLGTASAVVPASPLVPAPTSVALTYTKPSTAGAGVSVTLTPPASAGTVFYMVDQSTVPAWLSLNKASDTATSTTASTLTFTANSICGQLGAGLFSATVKIKVDNYQDLSLPVTVRVSSAPSTLTATPNTAVNNVSWGIGSAAPSYTIKLTSSNEPISWSASVNSTATTSGSVANWLILSSTSGVAYNFGSTINVTFKPLAFALAQVGDTLTSTVTINSSITITFTFHVTPPTAAITSLYPASVAKTADTAATSTILITGTGFVQAPSAEATVVVLGDAALETGSSATVLSSTSILLTIANSSTSAYLSDAGATGKINIGVYNPTMVSGSATVTSKQGNMDLNLVTTPLISTITSASTYLQPRAGTNPTFAPYDIVSIFGSNFCLDCDGSTNPATLVGAPDSTYFRYPTTLSPDPTATTPHVLGVKFIKTSDSSRIGDGYLLFATNSQINVLVPSAVASLTTAGAVKIVVSYGPTGSQVDSAAFPINIAASDPGIITLDSTGSGQGAILHYDATSQAYTLNSSSNKMPKTDTTHAIMIFATGLGAPTSVASNTVAAAAAAYPTTCISALGGTGISGYMQTINAMNPAPSTPWTSIDGAVIVGSKLTANHYPPCLTGVTVTINGVNAPVTYAGFVSDSVAGLYQINATLPAALGTVPGSGQVPVVVSVGTVKSQNTAAGTGTVYMYVQ